MDIDLDGAAILYAVAGFFGVLAALYFGRTVIFQLSTATKAFLLFLAFLGFVIGGLKADQTLLDALLYLLATASYISFFIYTALTFDLTTDQVFLFLAASSALFAGLGYAIRGGYIDAGDIDTRIAIGILAVLGLALTGFDVLGPQPSYETAFDDEIDPERGQAVIGQVTARNDFLLPRSIDLPDYDACVYRNGTMEREFISYERSPGSLQGRSSVTVNMTIHMAVQEDRETGEPIDIGTLPVQERGSCPDSLGSEGIVVTEGPDRRSFD